MDNNRPSKGSTILLSDLLKLKFFNAIYAKSDSNPDTRANSPRKDAPTPPVPPCPDKAAGGDAPARHKCACSPPEGGGKCTAGDRGKTGAGVTGSRTGRVCGPGNESDELPEGAVNPGLLRHIHNAVRFRLPQCFEGACVSVKQSSKNNWVLGHSISFSSVSPGGYKLLLSYVDKKNPSAVPYFVMEAAPGGQMSCEFRVGPTVTTRATVFTQIADAEFYSFESIVDAYFNRFTASVIAVNKDFIALHFLQAVSDQLSLGAEVVARAQVAELSSASGACRWVNENHSISATLGNRGLDLCCARAITPYLSTAAMLEWRSDEWTVRGSADSDGLVSATLQRALGGKRAQLACAISALLNHPNDKFRLGFSVTAAII
ncbi:putative mitochondrial import receptor subunit tom40 isoform 1 [Operophtera brumata]|uniref:Putative mitochondrial import receptor subunit tom40 isoform 1 n=1 Tax=Operophtera brumata TaxID=104452 RepID=A0A0L7KQ00_OPEBR|nr:putative mitochondrial import receptor subunit tom40 isoform 1 [Operophtera brumata]